MVSVDCRMCGMPFDVYPAWIRKGAGKHCSRRCSFDSKIGKKSYVRDEEHREKMSAALKSIDLSKQRKLFSEMNHAKKGKTYTEIYGETRANEIKARLNLVGENNPNWKGGKDRQGYPYIFYTLRESIISRDNFECKNCNISDEEVRRNDTLNRGLTIHHIDYDKMNNRLNNLITLCKACNSHANGRRTEWQEKYTQLLLGQ